jgi:cation diffusion facilitator family transporter
MTSEAFTRPRLVRRAMLLEVAVILYNLLEGSVSIIAGVMAGSVALLGFGLDSAIEVSASIAVLAHLWVNRRDESLEWERRVAMYVGVTLLLLATYVAVQAVYDLATSSEPDESYLGIAIAALSLIVMPFVARIEHSLSHEINSRSLEAESRETLMCTYLSAALLVGLGANALFGWWWADPIAALVIVGFLVKEGWEALTRRELCCID